MTYLGYSIDSGLVRLHDVSTVEPDFRVGSFSCKVRVSGRLALFLEGTSKDTLQKSPRRSNETQRRVVGETPWRCRSLPAYDPPFTGKRSTGQGVTTSTTGLPFFLSDHTTDRRPPTD